MPRALRWIVVALLGLLPLFAASSALDQALNRDEHQFVAPALLGAEADAAPYVDYAYFHMPLQVWTYQALFALTDRPFLVARLFQALAGLFCLSLLFVGVRRLIGRAVPEATWIAAAAVLLLAYNPMFAHTIGRAWNHASSTAFALAAFLLLLAGTARERHGLLLLCGLCFGASVGLRLTTAPLGLAFVVGCLWLEPHGSRVRSVPRRLGAFALGTAVALVPVAWAAFASPEAFWFGNFEYPALSKEYLRPKGIGSSWIGAEKLQRIFFSRETTPVAGVLMLVCFVLCWRAWPRGAPRERRRLLLAVLAWALVSVGAYAPSTVRAHYHFAPLAFAALGIGLAVGFLRRTGMDAGRVRRIFLPFVVLAALAGVYTHVGLHRLLDPAAWTVNELRETGRDVEAFVGEGPILTLAPIVPLAAGKRTYPELATGVFAWRSAPLVEPGRRSALRIVGPDELEAWLAATPPAGILTGFESDALEAPFVAWARAHGYEPIELPVRLDRTDLTLWVAPVR